MGVLRTTFLIDKKGKIIKIWDNVKVKDHAKEVLETIKKPFKKIKRPLISKRPLTL
jgi:peroxiredoxin Q/BCP